MHIKEKIDPSVMLESTCGDHNLIAELIDFFFELAREEVRSLADYIAHGDATSVLAFAHKLAGSAMACGMTELSHHLLELEMLCKQGMPSDVDERVQAIAQQLSDGREFWTAYLNEQQ